MFDKHSVGESIAQRVSALIAADSGWSQCLWRIGTLGALEECLSLAKSGATLTRNQYVINTARRVTEKDPAILGKRRGQILSSLPKKADSFALGSSSYFLLRHEVDNLRSDYYELWDTYLSKIDESEDVEDTCIDINSTASYIAAHLRTCGFSDKWIAKHCSYYLNHHSEKSSLRELLKVAGDIFKKGSGLYEFLVPLPQVSFGRLTGAPWLPAEEFSREFEACFPEVDPPTHAGGLLFRIEALEKYGAYDSFVRKFSLARVRSRIGAGNRELAFVNSYWVVPGDGCEIQFEFADPFQLTISALDSEEGRRLLQPLPSELEAALDLLSNRKMAPSRSSCITSWAVMETLFADPTDFGSMADIADRAADLLTCMYVTDLFIRIADRHLQAEDDDLCIRLCSATAGKRFAYIVEHISMGRSIPDGEGQDIVDLQEAKRLVEEERYLHTIRNEFSEALRRLYDVRNQIVHAGILEPYAMDATLLVASKLLIAIIDEAIEDSFHSEEPTALLAAKCRWLLNRVEGGKSLALLGAFKVDMPD
ncbi:hypothetical protein IU510_27210 [Nocardia cyriacigeorgica]|uniref:hypothetical protein n=1 Tax=Nocardia cyriacigeorgica TaxID=135487 RepID=UPI001893551E|nr:hypothetical protein [Nocardia cyriacigeorgica]MBF6101713.1 hypothetical protein [Nocardia cyriacigeorgica]